MLINIPDFLLIDPRYFSTSYGLITLDANGEYAAQLSVSLDGKTIRYIHIYVATVSNPGDFQISLKAIDDTPQPSVPGAILGVANSAYGNITISTTGWKRIQLTTDYTPAIGEQFFVDITPTNFQAGDSIAIGNNSMRGNDQIHYYIANGVSNPAILLICALESTDGTFSKIPVIPALNIATNIKTSSTPDEVGNIITLPYKHRVIGAVFILDVDYATDIILYGSSTLTASLIANRRQSTGVDLGKIYFSSSLIIDANVSYRLAIKPKEDNNIGVRSFIFPTTYETESKKIIMSTTCTISKTSRTDAGAWTNDSTMIYCIAPIIDQIGIPPYLHHTNLIGA